MREESNMRDGTHLSALRAISHPLAILAIFALLISALWVVLLLEQQRNHQAVENAVKTKSTNLTRAFEENVVRTFNEVDEALLLLRQAWEDSHSRFDQKVRFLQSVYPAELLVQVAVIGPDGRLAYSNLNPDARPIDLSDREHFKIHKSSHKDQLFISKPVKGRISHRYSIQMTRPILTPSGQFDGVLVISLNPAYFAGFFKSVSIGPNSSINLIGMDGVFRARGIHSELDESTIGTKLPSDRPFLQPDSPTVGYFETDSIVDGKQRLITYRHVQGYPMVVTVTQPVQDIFAQHEKRWFRYRIYASAVSLLLALSGIWLAWALRLQHRFRCQLVVLNDSLRRLNEIGTQSDTEVSLKLRKALELGCRHLDAELGMISQVSGDHCHIEHYSGSDQLSIAHKHTTALARDLCSTTLARGDILAIHHLRSSEFADHPGVKKLELESYLGVPIWSSRAAYGALCFVSSKPNRSEFSDNDIEFIRLLSRWIGSTLSEAQSLEELKMLATTDALTGAKSRGYFTDAAEASIRQALRYRTKLSMVLIDVDYFKHVNDRYGHGTGDEALKHITQICSESLRDSDLFARLGGEEFAVLLPHTSGLEALEVCERIRDRVEQSPLGVKGDDDVAITISAGVAEFSPHEDFRSLYNRVDTAMYQAKQRGRNGCVLAEDHQISAYISRSGASNP